MDYNIFHLFFRHCITFKVVSAESEMVNKEMTAPWKETKLRTILARYQTNDIFNADEFGLFYEVLPSNLCTSEVSVVQVENTAKCG